MGLRRLASPKSAGWAGQLEDWEEPLLQWKPEGHVPGKLLLA